MSSKNNQAKENKQSQNKKPQKQKKKDSELGSYARYTGMAFQMIIIIGIMTFVGVKLDERRNGDTPTFTAILSLLGVFAALYISLRDFIHKK